jgi:hypothetical protein
LSVVANKPRSEAILTGHEEAPPVGFEPTHTAPEARSLFRDTTRNNCRSPYAGWLPRCYKAVCLTTAEPCAQYSSFYHCPSRRFPCSDHSCIVGRLTALAPESGRNCSSVCSFSASLPSVSQIASRRMISGPGIPSLIQKVLVPRGTVPLPRCRTDMVGLVPASASSP